LAVRRTRPVGIDPLRAVMVGLLQEDARSALYYVP
jgi:hypothetical protein